MARPAGPTAYLTFGRDDSHSAPGDESELPRRGPIILSTHTPGNHAHSYIGKVCCLLLVRADYIGRALERPRLGGHGESILRISPPPIAPPAMPT